MYKTEKARRTQLIKSNDGTNGKRHKIQKNINSKPL